MLMKYEYKHFIESLRTFSTNRSNRTDMDDFTFKRKQPIRPTGSRIFSRSDTSKKRSDFEGGHVSTSLRKHNDDEFDGDVAEWIMEGTGRRVAYDDFTTIGS